MLTPAQRSVISGASPGRPRAGLIAGVAAGRALTGVMATAHAVIWT